MLKLYQTKENNYPDKMRDIANVAGFDPDKIEGMLAGLFNLPG
jgi:hypothetical protein